MQMQQFLILPSSHLNWACVHLHFQSIIYKPRTHRRSSLFLPSLTNATTVKEPCYLHSACSRCISSTSFPLHEPRRLCPTSESEVRAAITWGLMSQYWLRHGILHRPAHILEANNHTNAVWRWVKIIKKKLCVFFFFYNNWEVQAHLNGQIELLYLSFFLKKLNKWRQNW